MAGNWEEKDPKCVQMIWMIVSIEIRAITVGQWKIPNLNGHLLWVIFPFNTWIFRAYHLKLSRCDSSVIRSSTPVKPVAADTKRSSGFNGGISSAWVHGEILQLLAPENSQNGGSRCSLKPWQNFMRLCYRDMNVTVPQGSSWLICSMDWFRKTKPQAFKGHVWLRHTEIHGNTTFNHGGPPLSSPGITC